LFFTNKHDSSAFWVYFYSFIGSLVTQSRRTFQFCCCSRSLTNCLENWVKMISSNFVWKKDWNLRLSIPPLLCFTVHGKLLTTVLARTANVKEHSTSLAFFNGSNSLRLVTFYAEHLSVNIEENTSWWWILIKAFLPNESQVRSTWYLWTDLPYSQFNDIHCVSLTLQQFSNIWQRCTLTATELLNELVNCFKQRA